MKIYVTMTDKFMSGWGHAENKINKFIVECDTREQADTIMCNANKRSEMKYVNMTTKKPYYNTKHYYSSFQTYDELGGIWKN